MSEHEGRSTTVATGRSSGEIASGHHAGHRMAHGAVAEIALHDCHDAGEQAGLEVRLASYSGVTAVHFDRTRALAHLTYDPTITNEQRIRDALQRDGYRCDCHACADSTSHAGHPAVAATDAPAHRPASGAAGDAHAGHGAHMVQDMLRRLIGSAVLTLPIVIWSPLGAIVGFPAEPPFGISLGIWGFVFGTPVVLWGGWVFLNSAWRSLRRGDVTMMTLIALGVLVSYSYSVAVTFFLQGEVFYEAAAMLTTLSLLGHWLEMRARFSTGKAVEALLRLAPATARVRRNGEETDVPVEQVRVGDIVVTRPGDRLPVDGVVTEGQSYVDEAMITGEPIPANKQPGSKVVAGTVNQTGAFAFRADAVGADTALSRIVQMVQNAQASKAPAQRLADRAGRVLVYVALGAGTAAFLIWSLVGGQGFLFALTAGVSALVIACPDALALATPTAITVAVGKSARDGVLFKNATALEATATVNTVVLDKTGTLTEGRPALTDLVPTEGTDADMLLTLAAGADQPSQHPLAEAIVRAAHERGLDLPAAGSFDSLPGLGVTATVDGAAVLIGNRTLMSRYEVDVSALEDTQRRLSAEAKTAMYVASDGRALGVVAVADTVRPSAKGAIDTLHAMGVTTVMLTGDNRATAQAVADQLGIDTVIPEVLPQDKAARVTELRAAGKHVAMVGDGVNDAPALAEADVGVAIGAGTDVAVETAGVVLVKNDPADVARAIDLARKTRAKIRQNLVWAAAYNVVAIPVAGGALYPSLGLMLTPEWAALAMAASTVSVTLNALALNRARFRTPTRDLRPALPATT